MTVEHLGRDVIPYPCGPAVIETSRPAPGCDWTTTVTAPGLELDGYSPVTDSGVMAREMHGACVATVLEQIAAIPTVHIRGPI